MKVKVFTSSVLLYQVSAFAPHNHAKTRQQRTTNLSGSVLDGKELSGDFNPMNNMMLVKKSEIVDQTEGGIFLTGKVSRNKEYQEEEEEEEEEKELYLLFLRIQYILHFPNNISHQISLNDTV